MSDMAVFMQLWLTLKLGVLLCYSMLFVGATGLKICDTTEDITSFREPFSRTMVPCPDSRINCVFVGGTEAQTNCNLCCAKQWKRRNKTREIASVKPTTSIPTTKCGIMPGTKKKGFPQSFADNLEECPTNILHCVAVGDAEAQRNCEKCCSGSPTPTKTWAVKIMNYTLITPTRTTQNSAFVTSTISPTANKTECSIIPETNKRVFLQPFVGDIEPCPKVTSNCKTVGDEQTQNICLKCCTVNSGSDRRDEKNNETRNILLSVLVPVAALIVTFSLLRYLYKRYRTQVNTLWTKLGKPLASETDAESHSADPDNKQPRVDQVLLPN